ncbi:MAG: DUF2752 domain-containing protein [Lachnospiraceae bacterium]|nr:DUF2752 domain-containing protein [Lachnospiraceae bacterium]
MSLWLKFRELTEPYSWCRFKMVTGLYCPGCGGIRAFEALISGHPFLSFFYHPAVLYYLLLFLTFLLSVLFRPKKPKKWFLPGVFIGIALIFVQWILKNVLLLCFHIRWLP